MAKRKRKDAKKAVSFAEAAMSVRKTWGGFSPVTRVKGSKKAQQSRKACRGRSKPLPDSNF